MAKRKRSPHIPKARKPTLRSLVRELGAEAVAKRVGASASSVRRWAKDGVPEARRHDVAVARSRAAGARKGAETKARRLEPPARAPRVQSPAPRPAAPSPRVSVSPRPTPRPTPTAKKPTLRALVRELGAAAVAERMGTSAANVRRWTKTGVPSSREHDVSVMRNRAAGARKGAETKAKRRAAGWDPVLAEGVRKPPKKRKGPYGVELTAPEKAAEDAALRRIIERPPEDEARDTLYQGKKVRDVRTEMTDEGLAVFGTGPDGEPLRAWAIVDHRDKSARMRWMFWPPGRELPKRGPRDAADTYQALAPSRYRVQATWGDAA